MFYIFHGEDEYSLRQLLDEMKRKLGDPSTADLNTTVLDGRSASIDDIRTTCDTMPFLADRRLVIVEGLLARFEQRTGAAEGGKGRSDPLESGLREYLPRLPETARLVFVERVALNERNPILKLAKELGGTVRLFEEPAAAALSDWINKHVRAAGGTISPRAAETLGAFVGGNLRQMDQEINKLIAYAKGREIKEGDVQLLVADASEVKVWTMTEALASRQRDQAVGVLHQLLDDGEQPPVLMAVIARQFRSLVQIKELAEQGLSSDAIAGKLKMHPFRAQKLAATARSFTFDRLEAIYGHLLAADLAMKTGRVDPALALDLLMVEITGA